MMMMYILKDKLPVPCDNYLEWAMWYENFDNRQVARTELEGYTVSTIFLALQTFNSFLFETMVFKDGEATDIQYRYRTYEAAEKGHHRIVGDLILHSAYRQRMHKTFNLIKRLRKWQKGKYQMT